MINIQIDTSSLLDEVYLDKSEIDNLLDYSVKEITVRFAEEWKMEAGKELKSSRQQYISNINVVDEGFAKGAVVLTGWLPNAIESGISEFDMKENLLNGPNAKVGKNGVKYNTIPFSHGTPNSLEENFNGGVMPQEVHEVAKNKNIGDPIKKKELPKQFQEPQKKSIKQPTSQSFKDYQHKNSIYEGITKNKDAAGNTSYGSFRRVSENSSPDSWIHPGIEEHNLAEKALNEFDIQTQLSNIFDQWWENK